jgi:hypothetical protein
MKKFSAFILLPCAFALLTAGRVEARPSPGILSPPDAAISQSLPLG